METNSGMRRPPRTMVLPLLMAISLLASHCFGFIGIPSSSSYPSTTARTPMVLSYSSSSSSIPKDITGKQAVLYQKIVHAPPGTTVQGSWILHLLESLDDTWHLPDRLPMPYEKEQRETSMELSCVACKEASLNLTVVSILEHDLCVVVVQPIQPNFKVPPMMKSLLESSQKQLFKSLEHFLQDFSLSPVTTTDANEEKTVKQLQTIRENEQHMVDELYEDNTIIDAEIVKEYSKNESGIAVSDESAERRQAVLEAMNQPASQTPKTSNDEDFAVQAARRHADTQTNEFAVRAAQQQRRKVVETTPAANVKEPKETTKAKTTTTPKATTPKPKATPMVEEESTINLSAIRPPMLDDAITGVQRSFRHSVSRPEDYKPRMELRNNQKKKGTTQMTTKKPLPNDDKVDPRGDSKSGSSQENDNVSHTSVVNDAIDATIIDETAQNPGTVDATERKLNLVTLEERDPVVMAPSDEKSDDPAIRYTQEALDEMIEQSQDMTPEELLQDVMNFGKKAEQQEETGRGFVNGAFDTAKELLREKKTKKPPKTQVKELTPDEALKEMFQAGERLAEGRITHQEAKQSSISQSDNEMVDSLIDSDKTVSRHARVLDDELAELEVMIQRTPGEEYDDVTKASPTFDILSGPEVYNPNVDPKTAVNWPGALPGTKDVRLPKELDEALKQAKFAADVLMKIEEIEGTDGSTIFKIGNQTISEDQVTNLQSVVDDAIQIGLIDDPLELLAEESRLQMLIDELWNQPDERTREIVLNYKDLLLSEHFVAHVKKRLEAMVLRDLDALRNDDTSLNEGHQRERDILGELVSHAQLLLKEARALGAELEASQLEVIRSICKVAMDPSLKTEEETAQALTYAVRDMRPLFDDMFIAYLKYAVAEEEGRLARAGLLDDPAANDWLFVLKIVQQGVYKEISTSINRYLEHIWYILRMETTSERRMLLEELVNAMPTLDVRPFVQVVENIAGALGQSAKGEFDGTTELGEMTNKVLQLYRDVKEILPPERIDEKSRDADAWVARQRQRLMDQRQLTKQRLRASQDIEHLHEEIEAMDANCIGDGDRFD